MPLNVPWLPLVIVMSPSSNPVTASEKVKVNVIGPLAVPATSSLIVRVGAAVSMTSDSLAVLLVLPAASVAVAVTGLLPLVLSERLPLVGVAVSVSTDQIPPVAVVV